MIDFTLFSTSHSEAFSEPATGFTVIRKVSKAYGTGAHVLVPVQHAGKAQELKDRHRINISDESGKI